MPGCSHSAVRSALRLGSWPRAPRLMPDMSEPDDVRHLSGTVSIRLNRTQCRKMHQSEHYVERMAPFRRTGQLPQEAVRSPKAVAEQRARRTHKLVATGR